MARKPATKSSRTSKRSASKGATPRKKSAASDKPNYKSYSAEKLLELYGEMLLIRRFEEKAGQMYGMGLIGGFCHLYIGQEAVVVGMQEALQPQDSVITTYRDHGHMLACGMDPNGVMAELTGREGGYSRGKGGSMHMFSKEKNFYGGHGIVGANVPLGTGIAFSHKYQGDDGICLTYFGDGALNQGQVYESFNMAALWDLPVIYIIENNRYAMGTSVARASAEPDLFNRGSAYGIPGAQVDGMDVVKVFEGGKKAVDHVRSGKGPFILEMQTYRYRGHSMSDPAKYRTKEEVQKMRTEKDPIETLKAVLIELKVADEDSLKAIDRDVRERVNAAADFAQESPEPDPSELYTDILIEA
ncbi:MAG: pyruvate dehydrogenase (acetyl-transferring) E1 component subunit alpha [Rhodospirillaceae bacterium]|jgi:pyruvate dehydrogenase E1 component alpha subunit|nr:pyruvate dehydrogenase (acetyl-transferring) E1 component subunit alpha [Rhodospirillaceae bacterium]MBT5945877.1 pyruvate dehydrogenase (acetyl-transferring) E1 component subunit alpha [Rhodospirillaceae bacterium]MBT6403155.1 pyruvate dehydrogenase (acetyl-transferring) E1 component subunit alpha [Rhodospirillaceae bacterium]MBT6534734.1 pyruvate dehydrogenase (acetyl-transferring) E1 component subunit alpha [Rhodospirillaceae bacterium]